MRLINVHTRRLELFYHEPTEDYAILSHTWGNEEEELSFQDMLTLAERGAGRTAKLDGCCEQAKKDGLRYVWIDTCCIDKTNAVELSEAIHSMFKWYQKSKVCYTYLSDIEPGQSKGHFSRSRWFTRGWTLQELVASSKMEFFDSGWNKLGTKVSLAGLIIEATGIPHYILTGWARLDTASVAQRFSWASRRQTTRPEDMAYCLLGIFDVIIPLFYGEGLEAAFERLQEAIMRKNLDDSILAWSIGDLEGHREQSAVLRKSGGILASSPADFEGCEDIVRRPQTETRIQAFEIFGGMMPISISLGSIPAVVSDPLACVRYGYLSCGPESRQDCVVAIPLAESRTQLASVHGPPVYLRPRGLNSVIEPRPSDLEAPSQILIRKDRTEDVTQSEYRPSWFYLPGPYPWNAAVEDVYPAEFYESEVAMIKTPRGLDGEKTLFLIRFSYTIPENNQADAGHFIVGLEYFHDSSAGNKDPRACLYFDDDFQMPLSEIVDFWPSLAPSWTTEIILAAKPLTAVRVSLKREIIASHHLWVIKLSDLPPSHVTEFSQGWPSIPQQIHLRKQGHDLIQLLRKGAALSRNREELARNQLRCDKEIQDIEENLEVLAEERKRLITLERNLQVRLRDQMENKTFLSMEAKEYDEEQNAITNKVAQMEEARALGWLQAGLSLESPKSRWATEKRQEREGTVAYLMQQAPIIINGEKMAWAQGITLLMYAAASGDAEFIKRVVRYDADLTAKDSAGRTALDWAELAGSKASSELLSRLVEEVQLHETGPNGQLRHPTLEETVRNEKGKEIPGTMQEIIEISHEDKDRESKDSACYMGLPSLDPDRNAVDRSITRRIGRPRYPPSQDSTRIVFGNIIYGSDVPRTRTGQDSSVQEVGPAPCDEVPTSHAGQNLSKSIERTKSNPASTRRKSWGSVGWIGDNTRSLRTFEGTVRSIQDERIANDPLMYGEVEDNILDEERYMIYGPGPEKAKDKRRESQSIFAGLGRLARRVSDKVTVAPASSAATQLL